MHDFTEILEKSRLARSLPAPERRTAIREAAMVTQEDIATALGVTRAIVSRWEAGLRIPSGEHLTNYARLLKALEDDMETD